VWKIIINGLVKDTFNTIVFTAIDKSTRGNPATLTLHIKYDPTMTDAEGPVIKQISGSVSGDTVSSASVTIVDSVYDQSGVDSVYATINGNVKTILARAGNLYTLAGTLTEGLNTIVITAKDSSTQKNLGTQTILLYYMIPPTITTQPIAQTVCPGTSITLSVEATGTSPLIYRWYKGPTRVGLTDSTSGSFRISALALTDTGKYCVTISNRAGSVTSDSAQLSATRYYVAFNCNGGSTVDTQHVICNYYATEPASPSKSGYKFAGWYTNPELTSAIFDFSSSSNVITTNRTLYASWDKAYKLTFDIQNAETAAKPDTMIVVTGKTVDSLPTAPSKTSYVFDGWYTGTKGAGTQFTQSTIVTADVTVYAYWVIKDYDGNIYTEVTIGTQTWMVENLRTTKYNDGTSIPNVTGSSDWSGLTTPGYCYYNNTTNADSIKKFGALYNWYAVNTGKLAPTGWHVPDTTEWNTLQNYLIANGYNYDGTTDSNKIAKSLAAKTDWFTSTTTGAIGNDLTINNSSGFSALPGGCRGYDGYGGTFVVQSRYGYWWSATESNASNACYRGLYYGYYVLYRDSNYKSCGFSVRLLRDN
jgi:uncharacterized protein (TIGR02145 family)/uncharacterized repeat protein (TIGR02543 family)